MKSSSANPVIVIASLFCIFPESIFCFVAYCPGKCNNAAQNLITLDSGGSFVPESISDIPYDQGFAFKSECCDTRPPFTVKFEATAQADTSIPEGTVYLANETYCEAVDSFTLNAMGSSQTQPLHRMEPVTGLIDQAIAINGAVVVCFDNIASTRNLSAAMNMGSLNRQRNCTTCGFEDQTITAFTDSEPTTATMGPEPTTATMGSESTTATMYPESTTGTMDPEQTTATMDPESTTATMDPEPTTATMGPEQTTAPASTPTDRPSKIKQPTEGFCFYRPIGSNWKHPMEDVTRRYRN